MHSHAIRAHCAAILVVCASIAAACDSSPVNVESRSLALSGTFSVSPLKLDFGSTATSKSVTLTNSGSTSLTWAASEGVGWLALNSTWGTIAAGSSRIVDVKVNRTGKSPGGYSTYIHFSGGTAGSAKIPVSMIVPSTLSVSPVKVDFGSIATSVSVTLTNSGTTSLTWTASEGAGWLALGSTSGTIPAKSSKTLGLKISRTGRSAGAYSTNVSFSAGTAGSAKLPVSMTVPSTSTISITPVSLSFGLTATELSFTIENTGGSSLSWTGQASAGWATLPVSGGNLPAGGSQDVVVRVSRVGLTAGDYQTAIQLTSNGGNTTVGLGLKVGSTVNVRDFGARGDGITDDSPAFREALEALPASGGTIMVPGGAYIMSSIYTGPFRPINLSRDNVTIIGDGMNNTILKMATEQYPTAAYMILINRAAGITIKNLTIDMNVSVTGGGTFYADEQSHGIRVVSSSDVRIDGVRFRNSPGDGIYLLGLAEEGDPWTERVWIENSHFTRSWRNGITVQRAVRHLQIRGNTFDEISQQAISSEPSGSGAPTDILVEDNLIRHWEQTSSYTVALSGTRPTDSMKRLTFRRNRIENGVAYFLWMEDLIVEDNTIIGGPYKSALRLQDVTHAVVTDNVISGIMQNESGVVQILNEDDQLSSDILMQNNRIDVGPGLTAIYVRDALGGITITGNELSGWGGGYGILFANLIATGTIRSGFRPTGNVVNNFATGIGFVVRGERFSNVEVRSNTIDDESPANATGILFDGTGAWSQFAQVASNTFGPGITTPIKAR